MEVRALGGGRSTTSCRRAGQLPLACWHGAVNAGGMACLGSHWLLQGAGSFCVRDACVQRGTVSASACPAWFPRLPPLLPCCGTQMAGRAGRRGYDTVGNCVILQVLRHGRDQVLARAALYTRRAAVE